MLQDRCKKLGIDNTSLVQALNMLLTEGRIVSRMNGTSALLSVSDTAQDIKVENAICDFLREQGSKGSQIKELRRIFIKYTQDVAKMMDKMVKDQKVIKVSRNRVGYFILPECFEDEDVYYKEGKINSELISQVMMSILYSLKKIQRMTTLQIKDEISKPGDITVRLDEKHVQMSINALIYSRQIAYFDEETPDKKALYLQTIILGSQKRVQKKALVQQGNYFIFNVKFLRLFHNRMSFTQKQFMDIDSISKLFTINDFFIPIYSGYDK
ncbi:MAG: hypothetical protein EZS28_004558 [Streblomastix strix]|uniref:Uncharacterized protein n=1 Tax=Streblomastix strix TaxID=222440 RepID=A0A5J4WXV6_9EUKA|nr:MAG: hypothetical protein EZS28_004558 [Streblomastix strix]